MDDFDKNCESIRNLGLVDTTEFPDRNMIAGYATSSDFNNIKKSTDVEAAYLDYRFSLNLEESLPIVNFDKAYYEFGLTGSGKKICILDTGINNSVVNYSYGYDFVNDDSNPSDDNGHGTQVASV